jgi:hypothetical protein
MADARYFIRQVDEEWMIRFGEEDFGPYRTQAEAMLFAVEAARKLGEHGGDPEVYLVGQNGHFRPEWTYRPGA